MQSSCTTVIINPHRMHCAMQLNSATLLYKSLIKVVSERNCIECSTVGRTIIVAASADRRESGVAIHARSPDCRRALRGARGLTPSFRARSRKSSSRLRPMPRRWCVRANRDQQQLGLRRRRSGPAKNRRRRRSAGRGPARAIRRHRQDPGQLRPGPGFAEALAERGSMTFMTESRSSRRSRLDTRDRGRSTVAIRRPPATWRRARAHRRAWREAPAGLRGKRSATRGGRAGLARLARCRAPRPARSRQSRPRARPRSTAAASRRGGRLTQRRCGRRVAAVEFAGRTVRHARR